MQFKKVVAVPDASMTAGQLSFSGFNSGDLWVVSMPGNIAFNESEYCIQRISNNSLACSVQRVLYAGPCDVELCMMPPKPFPPTSKP